MFVKTKKMGLSTDACKNLVDALEKLNLAATAVSIALLSNAALVPNPDFQKAVQEFRQLLRIKDQAKSTTFTGCVAEEIGKGLSKIEFNWGYPTPSQWQNLRFKADFPSYFFINDFGAVAELPVVDDDPSISPAEPRFGDAVDIETFRENWNNLAVTPRLLELCDPPKIIAIAGQRGESLGQPSVIENSLTKNQDVWEGIVAPLHPIGSFALSYSHEQPVLTREYALDKNKVEYIRGSLSGVVDALPANLKITLEFAPKPGPSITPLSSLLRHCSPTDAPRIHDFSKAFPNLEKQIEGDSDNLTTTLD
jgi:hypothetical protein